MAESVRYELERKKLLNILKIPDLALQAPKVVEWMLALSSEVVVAVFSDLIQDSIAGIETARAILGPRLMTMAIFERLPSNKRQSLFSQAVALGLPLVAALFSDLPPDIEEPPLSAFRIVDVRPSGEALTRERDPITLGERRSLAKSKDLKVLEKMLFDPDPLVVENLLNNPHLSEEHVLRLAARRPHRSEILRTLGTHPHWGKHLKIRIALIKNPYTPPILSVLGLLTLSIQDIIDISWEGKLHDLPRDVAQEIIKKRKALTPAG